MEGRNGSTDEGGRRPATAGRYTQIKRAKGIPLGELRRGGSGCYPRRGLNIRRKMTHLQPQIIPLVGLNIRRTCSFPHPPYPACRVKYSKVPDYHLQQPFLLLLQFFNNIGKKKYKLPCQ